jgi:hypothetical protein
VACLPAHLQSTGVEKKQKKKHKKKAEAEEMTEEQKKQQEEARELPALSAGGGAYGRWQQRLWITCLILRMLCRQRQQAYWSSPACTSSRLPAYGPVCLALPPALQSRRQGYLS